MSTSQNIYAIKDRAPEFPCWIWVGPQGDIPAWGWLEYPYTIETCLTPRWTHWCKHDTRPLSIPAEPKATPSQPAAPELPESVNPKKVWWCKVGFATQLQLPTGPDGPMRSAVAREFASITGRRANFIFSGWNGELTEPELAVVENRMPREVYGVQQRYDDLVKQLRTLGAMIDCTIGGTFETHPPDAIADVVRAQLASARAEVERLEKDNGIWRESHEKRIEELNAVSAQLATAKEELEAQTELTANYSRTIEADENEMRTIRSDLAKANAAVEEAKQEVRELTEIGNARHRRHHDQLESDSIVGSCDCLTKTNEVKFHRPGCKYRLICERDEARSQLSALRAPVAPAERAVETVELLKDCIVWPDRFFDEDEAAKVIQRTCFPPAPATGSSDEAILQILRDIVVVDENHVLDVIVGGIERLRNALVPPGEETAK